MKVLSWTSMAVAVLALAGAPSVQAQQSTQTQTPNSQTESNRTGQAGQRDNDSSAASGTGQAQALQPLDQMIATAVAIANEEEIQLAQLAASRAQSNEVKEFAREMEKQHTELGQKLTQITGQRITLEGKAGSAVIRGQSPETERSSSGQSNQQQERDRTPNSPAPGQPGQSQAGQTGQPGQSGQAGHSQGAAGHEIHQLVQIKRDIAQRCLQNTEREMQALSGSEFDKAYIGQQAVLHGQMLAALQVYQQHASPQLAQTLAQAEQVTERHLQHAKQICKQLDGKSQEGSQERSSTSKN